MNEGTVVCTRCGGFDQTLQRCRLGPELINDLRLTLNSIVRIKTSYGEFICRVWPREDLQEGVMSVSDRVMAIDDHDGKLAVDWLNCRVNVPGDLNILKSVEPKSLDLTIVVNENVDISKLKLRHKLLDNYLHNILDRRAVVENSQIDCTEHDLCALYGFHKILIMAKDQQQQQQQLEDGVDYALTIGAKTKLIVKKILSKARHEQRCHKQKFNIAGLDQQIKVLTDLIKLPQLHGAKLNKFGIPCSTGVLLLGPPGCGKTSLVRRVAAICDCYVVTVNGPELLGNRPGETETNLQNLFLKAKNHSLEGPCILFFDEIDSLCPKTKKSGAGQEEKIVKQLVTLLDDLHECKDTFITVIAATNRPNAIDSVLRRPGRLEKEVFVGIPTADQRLSILKTHLSKVNLGLEIYLERVAQSTNGYVGADLASLCREITHRALKRLDCISQPLQADLNVTMEDFKVALSTIRPSTQRGSDVLVDYRPMKWENIGGLDSVKQQLQQAVEWPILHPDAFKRMGISPPKGVLLYGPPGCCKTTLVRAAATACGATFLAISGAQLFSPYVGDSEKVIVQVFQQARAGAPSILFFDEIDAIVGKRTEKGSSGVQERVLSTLLNQMDGIGIKLVDKTNMSQKIHEGDSTNSVVPEGVADDVTIKVDNRDVLVVAATNRPDMLDAALLRPGRMDRLIFVPPPDKQTRMSILKVHTAKMPVAEINIDLLSDLTVNYTGADLESLCREAALQALMVNGLDASVVKQEHFISALSLVKPSLSQEQLKYYNDLHLKIKTDKSSR
ncbi:ATPase family gene 2 protein homolog B-like [Tubulanus polymorphus]|uniref:ATPase family gene 2 protein homolog B-like n=1 Tax=Tubulanus polymorphus TaxID=672921 RepID=UPI003DA2C5B2